MTITMRKAMSAFAAFCEIWLPQLAPTELTLIWFCGTPAERRLHGARLRRGEVAGLHLPLGGLPDGADPLHDGVAAAAGRADRLAHLGDRGAARRELVDRAALEVHAEVQPE